MYALESDEIRPGDAFADEVVLCDHCGSHFMVYVAMAPRCPECGTEAAADGGGLSSLYDEEVQEWAFAANPGDQLSIVDTDWLGGAR